MFLSSEYVKEGYTPSDHGEFADTAFFISEHPLFTGIDYGKEGKQYRFRFGRRYAFKVPTTKNWAFLRPVVMEGEYGRYQEQEEGMLIVADSVLTGVLIPGVNWGSNNESFDPFLFFQLGKEQTSSTSAGWYVFVPVDELELLKIDIID